jgi:hypothetical protein
MRIDVHTHVVPTRWDDWAARFGGSSWPRVDSLALFAANDMGEANPAGFLAGAGLDAAVRTGIEHGNAVRFLALA